MRNRQCQSTEGIKETDTIAAYQKSNTDTRGRNDLAKQKTHKKITLANDTCALISKTSAQDTVLTEMIAWPSIVMANMSRSKTRVNTNLHNIKSTETIHQSYPISYYMFMQHRQFLYFSLYIPLLLPLYRTTCISRCKGFCRSKVIL